MNLADLRKPFSPDRISWRVGSTTKDKSKGMALAYIDARDVQDRLDEVCGQTNWQCRYVPMHDKKTVCEIGVLCRAEGMITSEWVWKSDGAGDSDIEAEKGALSDAFKRAAVRWGVGRYLYDLESPWVELDTYEKNGQTFAKGIKPGEYKRLEALLGKQAAPASNGNGSKPSAAAPTQRDAIHTPMREDPDVAEGVKNWVNKEKGKIAMCARLPDVLMWKDEREAELHRLFKKAPEAHRDLMDYFQQTQTALSKKEAAE